MSQRHYFFAGGGTGGHIYPNIAVAQKLREIDPEGQKVFFCSPRAIDAQILCQYDFEFLPLPARPFDKRPDRMLRFLFAFIQSYEFVKKILRPYKDQAVLLSSGGFSSAPAMLAAGRLKVPIIMMNIDMVPGKANKMFTSLAREIFIQFEASAKNFVKTSAPVHVSGCPLREQFDNPEPLRAVEELGLDNYKKILLITGASSGAASINEAVCKLLPMLGQLNDWQIVHLTGRSQYQQVLESYQNVRITHTIVDYYENMADLLGAAHLVVGRAGAVSVAEFAASGKAVIFLPYPYHDDRHQYQNASPLVEAGGAVIVDDIIGESERTAQELGNQLLLLMADRNQLEKMGAASRGVFKAEAAKKIAENTANMPI
jgi:UDP-N-acetylglucosamine--N-acetylmuramyl-(pentapeptide) pyrophosphoryl-undecaprenol N-acetylglucosamine transferase